eukprot:6203780-Pleurochrysis_carterae.AAC.2
MHGRNSRSAGRVNGAAAAATARRSVLAQAGMETLRRSQVFKEAVARLRAAALIARTDDHGGEGRGTVGTQPRWRAVGAEVYVSAQ